MYLIYILDVNSIVRVLEALALILGAYTLMFVFLHFHPNMALNVSTEWANQKEGVLLIKIDATNVSKVKCNKNKVLFQVLEYNCNFESLSEWVAFSEDRILESERPVLWNPPVDILESTEFWYPGDSVKVERLYKCKIGRVYKIGVQLKADIPLLGRVSKVFRNGAWKKQEQWTTTKIIYTCS